jgi:RimJ/RimL family protein N-acetyltransferase
MATTIESIQVRPETECFVRTDLGQGLMAVAYLRMEQDGLLETVFFQHIPTLKEFIGWLEARDNRFLGCFVRNDANQAVLAGLAWLWNIRGAPGGRKADCGFVVFREFMHHRLPLRLIEKTLEYSFEVENLDVVYGLTLADNRPVLIFGRRLGFTFLPPLPKFASKQGVPCDAVMSFLTREDWRVQRWTGGRFGDIQPIS